MVPEKRGESHPHLSSWNLDVGVSQKVAFVCLRCASELAKHTDLGNHGLNKTFGCFLYKLCF